MAYSLELEDKIDHCLIDNEDLFKQRIIGGIGYLINGNLCFAIYEDYLVLRTTPENVNKLLEKDGFRPFDFDQQSREDIVMVEPEIHDNLKMLDHLLNEGIRYTKTLPEKEDPPLAIG